MFRTIAKVIAAALFTAMISGALGAFEPLGAQLAPPAAPTGLTAAYTIASESDTGRVDLSWDVQSGVHWVVERKTCETCRWRARTPSGTSWTQNSWTDVRKRAPEAVKIWFYRVKAVNASGSSAYSGTLEVANRPYLPTRVEGVFVIWDRDAGHPAVHWTSSHFGEQVDSYDIYRRTENPRSGWQLVGNEYHAQEDGEEQHRIRFHDSDVSRSFEDQTLSYRVSAVSGTDESTDSSYVATFTIDAFTEPGLVTLTRAHWNESRKSIIIKWELLPPDAVDGYRVVRSGTCIHLDECPYSVTGSRWFAVLGTETNKFEDTSIEQSKYQREFKYYVIGVHGDLESDRPSSEQRRVWSSPNAPPPKPSIGDVAWTQNIQDAHGVNGMQIRFGRISAAYAVAEVKLQRRIPDAADAKDRSWTTIWQRDHDQFNTLLAARYDTVLREEYEQAYQYRMATRNVAGWSEWSDVGTATAPAGPPRPSSMYLYLTESYGSNQPLGGSGTIGYLGVCAGQLYVRAYWNGSHYPAADEWELDYSARLGASVLQTEIRYASDNPKYPEFIGKLHYDASGAISFKVRGRYGNDWTDWSPVSTTRCKTSR